MLTRARALACAAPAAAALALSACGGDGGGVDSDDPASLAPADAPIYIQATIRPKGKLKTNAETLASAVSGIDDPPGRLIELLEESANEEPTLSGEPISFDQDIDPWLGETAGVFVEGFEGDPPAAGIVQTTDSEAAQQFIDDSKQEGDKDGRYEGTDYLIDGDDDTAAGIVDDFLVVGTESAFKRVVDVSGGEDALGDQDDFTSTLDEAPSGSLADVYVSLEEVTKQVRASDPDDADSVEASIGDTSGKTALASLVPAADSLELDLATNADPSFEFADLSRLIGTFPANSFAAIGIPDLGGIVERTLDQLEESGVGGVTREAIDQQLAAPGLSLDDITAALGDFGAFAIGTDEASLQGAGVIDSEDSAKAEELVGRLTELALRSGQAGISRASIGEGITIRDAEELGSQPLTISTLEGRIAIAYGSEALDHALAGRSPILAEDPAFTAAVKDLGGNGLSAYIALPGVFRLADALGAIEDPGYQQARPYLDKLTHAAFGSGEQGDFQTSKVIVGVQP